MIEYIAGFLLALFAWALCKASGDREKGFARKEREKMSGQMDLFQQMGPTIKAGDIVAGHGKELTWQEIEKSVGGLVVLEQDKSSTLVIVELVQVTLNQYGRKQIAYSDNGGLFDYADKAGITRGKSPVRFYEI